MKYTAFHYDMDGVLVDSEPVHVQSEKDTCDHFGLDVDYDAWGDMKGKTATVIFNELYNQHILKHGAYDIPPVDEIIKYKTKQFLKLVEDGAVEPIEGAVSLLYWTHEYGEGQSLVTSSNRKVASAILRQFGLYKYFDRVITGDDVRFGKPHPEPYVRSIRAMHTKPSRSLVFEDSKAGVRSALGARCSVMALTSSYHDEEVLNNLNATHVVNSWYEAPYIIEAA